jgi:hypothetical protein
MDLPEIKGSIILSDFSACMFEYEDQENFEKEFDIMKSKMQNQT